MPLKWIQNLVCSAPQAAVFWGFFLSSPRTHTLAHTLSYIRTERHKAWRYFQAAKIGFVSFHFHSRSKNCPSPSPFVPPPHLLFLSLIRYFQIFQLPHRRAHSAHRSALRPLTLCLPSPALSPPCSETRMRIEMGERVGLTGLKGRWGATKPQSERQSMHRWPASLIQSRVIKITALHWPPNQLGPHAITLMV